jgi:hypothetical protein
MYPKSILRLMSRDDEMQHFPMSIQQQQQQQLLLSVHGWKSAAVSLSAVSSSKAHVQPNCGQKWKNAVLNKLAAARAETEP